MKNSGKIQHLWLFQFAAHFFAVTAAYYTTWWLRFNSATGIKLFTVLNRLLGVRKTGDLGGMLRDFYIVSGPRIVAFLTVSICLLYGLRSMYSARRFIRKRPVAWDIIVANVIALVLYYVYFYLRRNVFHPRSLFATMILLNMLYCMLFTSMAESFLQFLRESFKVDRCHAVLVGEGKEADYINSLVEILHPHGIIIEKKVSSDKEEPFDALIKRIEKSVRDNHLDMIIFAGKQFAVADIMRLLQLGEELDVPVKVLSDKLSILINQARILTDMIFGVPLVHFDAPRGEELPRIKQALSIMSGYLLIVLLLPVIIVIALLIKLTSRGKVFFIQERIGVNRKPFQMYKFRTMYKKAEEDVAQMEEFNESGGGLFKIKKDPRVTFIGRFLRRFSLDELPQLINVIRSEMNVVGPRPLPRRDYSNYYEDWHYSRHSGMPGLTCLWQVSGRSDIDFHNMCILDVYYLRNHTWILDVKIILRTFIVVLSGKGAY